MYEYVCIRIYAYTGICVSIVNDDIVGPMLAAKATAPAALGAVLRPLVVLYIYIYIYICSFICICTYIYICAYTFIYI